MFVLGAFDDCYLMTLLTFVDAHEAYWVVSNVAIFIDKEYPLGFLCTRSIFLHKRPLIFGRKKPCFAVKNSLQSIFFSEVGWLLQGGFRVLKTPYKRLNIFTYLPFVTTCSCLNLLQ